MRGKKPGKKVEKPSLIRSQDICNTLYLTPPGKLWTNHMELIDTRAFKKKIQENVQDKLAIHSPQSGFTQRQLWMTWGVWVDGYSPPELEVNSSLRKEWESTAHMYANTKTDSVLDEYIKTSDVPISGKAYSFSRYTPHKHSLINAKMRLQQVSHSDVSRSQKEPVSVETSCPLDVLDHAQHHTRVVREIVKQTKTLSYSTEWPPSSSNTTHITNHNYTPFPPRLQQLQIQDRRVCPMSSHPWHHATTLWERLELYLESLYSSRDDIKTVTYKKYIQTVEHIIRMLVTRGSFTDEFIEKMEHSLDLLDVVPTLDSLLKREEYLYTTTKSILNSTHNSFQTVFGSSPTYINLYLSLLRVLQPQWHSRVLQPSADVMDLRVMQTLLSKYHASHSNETTRQKYVKHMLPSNTSDATVLLYSKRYEQLVRAQALSDSSIRKEQHLMTCMYSLLKIPDAKTLTQSVLHVNGTQTISAPVKASKSLSASRPHSPRPSPTDNNKPRVSKRSVAKARTLHITLNAKDRVPQSVDVRQKKDHTRTVLNKRKFPTSMQSSTSTSTSKPSPSTDASVLASTSFKETTGGVKGNPSQNQQTGGGIVKKKKHTGSSRTITLVTTANTKSKTNTKTKSKSGASNNKSPLIQISKTNFLNPTARYLTTKEVTEYRTVLKQHIKSKGGALYVSELQEKQGKKHPHIHLNDVLPSSSPYYNSIQKKHKLSAKNRNALRRVNRSVLQKFGGSHTCKNTSSTSNITNNPHDNIKNTQEIEYTGALYTRKRSGGSIKQHVPHITWNNIDSLGNNIRDTSQTDLQTNKGVTSIDLSQLGSVNIG